MQSREKIDVTDETILKILIRDSRTSFTEIAKACEISVPAVRVRYNNLRKAGIILGTTIGINLHNFGYKCVADVGIIVPVDHEEEVRENLKRRGTFVAPGRGGKYSILALVASPSLEKLSEEVTEGIASNPYVTHTDTLIWVEKSIFGQNPTNLALKPSLDDYELREYVSPVSLDFEDEKIDALDLQIIKILLQNSRKPFKQIAEQLGTSTNTVIHRYNRLREKNIVTNCTVIINLAKLGYNAFVSFFIKLEKVSTMPDIYAQLAQIPNLIDITKFIGVYDFRLVVSVTNLEEILNLSDYFRKIKGISQLDMSVDRIPGPWPPFKSSTRTLLLRIVPKFIQNHSALPYPDIKC